MIKFVSDLRLVGVPPPGTPVSSTYKTNRLKCFEYLVFNVMVYNQHIISFNIAWWSSWSSPYGSWINNYLCNLCLSPLKLWVRISLMARCTRYNFMWLSLSLTCDMSVVFPGTLVSSPTKTDRHGVTEILLKVALNIIILSILLYLIYRLDFKLSVKPVPILFISIPNNSEMYLKQSFVI
jgi:hypothetical protein